MVRPSAELLDEICVRFIINLPPEELECVVLMCGGCVVVQEPRA